MLRISYSAKNVVWYRCNIVLGEKGGTNTKSQKFLHLIVYKLPIERALGIQWSAESDEFYFKIVIKERPLTRRGILSVMSSIYDPLGLLSSVILPVKVIFQELCRLKLGWDDTIPDEYHAGHASDQNPVNSNKTGTLPEAQIVKPRWRKLKPGL